MNGLEAIPTMKGRGRDGLNLPGTSVHMTTLARYGIAPPRLGQPTRIVRKKPSRGPQEVFVHMRASAFLRLSLAGISSVPRESLVYRQLIPRSNPVLGQRTFGATPRAHFFFRKRGAVSEAEWTITKEELEDKDKLVASLRKGIWAGANGGMLNVGKVELQLSIN